MLKGEKTETVCNPPHYQSETGLEAIDVIEAFTSELEGVEAFDTGNILKYMCRWSKKNGLEDLQKARWYLDHLIEHRSKKKIVGSKKLNYGDDKFPDLEDIKE